MFRFTLVVFPVLLRKNRKNSYWAVLQLISSITLKYEIIRTNITTQNYALGKNVF